MERKSVYVKSKLLSSTHLMNLFKSKKFPCTVLRLYQAYGPMQDLNRFLPFTIVSCIKNKKFPCSEGKQFRDFVHVEDVVDSIIKSLINKDSKGHIINIGSGKPKKIKNIIQKIKKILNGGHPQFGEIKLRKDEILKIYPNTNKAKKILGWYPKIKFETGLRKTIKSFNLFFSVIKDATLNFFSLLFSFLIL